VHPSPGAPKVEKICLKLARNGPEIHRNLAGPSHCYGSRLLFLSYFLHFYKTCRVVAKISKICRSYTHRGPFWVSLQMPGRGSGHDFKARCAGLLQERVGTPISNNFWPLLRRYLSTRKYVNFWGKLHLVKVGEVSEMFTSG
jgi:hypothetical protein